ncbi:death-on-curing protein [Anaerophilus nitritogenes]|uniref:death-on-curing protein n=1 Tax=Anaerophilus nitritogenes TaxID=2498136 RepID=UPI00101BA72E|nr:death-on-curing protein [Anaerophilus nitritogenes]
MEDKYDLSLRESIFLAKKLLVDSIYNCARVEGSNITFPDTQTILEGVSIDGFKMLDVELVLGIRDAYNYVLDDCNEHIDINYIYKINSQISRNQSFDNEIVQKDKMGKKLDAILLNNSSTTQNAIELFLWSCKEELFDNYSKSTSIIIANKLLISEGRGLLIIKEKNLEEFNKLLVESYKSKEDSRISKFLYENCIYGLQIDRELKEKYKRNKFQ